MVLEPQAINIGTVNEDFAVESLAGDVFQLGNASYRILRMESGRVRVEDAQGQPPNIPFWLGEAPGRSDELSFGVARLREQIGRLLDGEEAEGDCVASQGKPHSPRLKSARAASSTDSDSSAAHGTTALTIAEATQSESQFLTARLQRAIDWLIDTLGLEEAAARQIVDYLARARAALSVLPTQNTLVMERFFDESGGTQLVIHAPFGSRVNRAWGLALRKRFCRHVQLRTAGRRHRRRHRAVAVRQPRFPLDDVWRYLHSNTAEHVLIQALLDAPLFGVRWRWNATTALALAALHRRPQVAAAIAAHEERRSAGDGVSRAGRVPGEHRRRTRTCRVIRWSTRPSMTACTKRWTAKLARACCVVSNRATCDSIARDLPAPSPLAAEILNGASPTPFSTTRRSKSAARKPC